MGTGPLSQAVSGTGALVKAVNAEQPPANPQTPKVRINTQQIEHLNLYRMIASIDRALEREPDDTMVQILSLFKQILESRKAGTAPPQLLDELQRAIVPVPQSMTGAPGSSGGIMPGPANGPTLSAAPAAAPPPASGMPL